jgi:hypothetical protein
MGVWESVVVLLFFQTPVKTYQERMDAAIARQRASLERQMKTVRERHPEVFEPSRAGAPGGDETVGPPADPVANCKPMSPPELSSLIKETAARDGLTPDLLRAVIHKESAFNPCAVSRAGARGLMQLMPSTIQQFKVEDPFNPTENVAAGSKLLKQLLTRYGGDLSLALGAYNAGPGRVDAAGGIPLIPETIDYVSTIMDKLKPENTQDWP